LKSPEQITAELDTIMAQPTRPMNIYFVDDNFIGNRKATKEMLPHLIEWQKRNGYPLTLSCEATLNIAKQKDILAMMREAGFVGLFAGIETPELDALKGMRKDHNASLPMLEAINTLNSYGIEVTSGIIIGLDTDTERSADRLIEFIEQSHIPMLTMNLLQALPKTPLYDRLARAGRIVDDPTLESNVRFLRPYDEVLASWRRCVEYAYTPERLFERYRYQVDATYANRLALPARGRLSFTSLRQGAVLAYNLLIRVGVFSDYRQHFWRAAKPALMRGQVDAFMGMGFVAHHLVKFSREALRGEQNASFYSTTEKRNATQGVTAAAV
jgi:radical SAM superfamily enzyme YgiQ (UPF0313 family)